MATAKLWWNGSEWKTTQTKWQAISTYSSSAYCWVDADFYIIAYDNFTLGFSGTIGGGGSGTAVASGSRTITEDGTTITTFSLSDTHTQTRTATITSPTATIKWSGSARVSVWKNDGPPTGLVYGTPWEAGSGTTTITSPFCTITYDANGGTGDVGTQTTLQSIEAAITPENVPTREYYQFVGWNTKADGTGTSYGDGANITITEDTTLYAQWSQTAFAVSISADEGATITLDGQSFTNQTTTIYKDAGTYALTITANAGFIIKTRSPANDGNVTISDNTTSLSATSQRVGCHLDDGVNYVQAVMYYDDGATWNMIQAYVDDGANWRLVY